MGVFDSYHFNWGGSSLECQTKQFDQLMRNWIPGDRIPLRELGASDAARGSLLAIEEDENIGRLWSSPVSARRMLLLHDLGSFSDFASIPETADIQPTEFFALGAWEPRNRTLLRTMARFKTERDAEALTGILSKIGSIPQIEEVIGNAKAAKQRLGTLSGLSFFNKENVDLMALGQIGGIEQFESFDVHSTKEALTSTLYALSAQLHDFCEAIEIADPLARASPNKLWGPRWGGAGDGKLSQSIFDAARDSETCQHPKTDSEWLAALDEGLFSTCLDSAATLMGPHAAISKRLSTLCQSRLGAEFALRCLASRPDWMPGALEMPWGEVGLLEWAAKNLGCPGRLLAPLLSFPGAGAGPGFFEAVAMHGYDDLLESQEFKNMIPKAGWAERLAGARGAVAGQAPEALALFIEGIDKSKHSEALLGLAKEASDVEERGSEDSARCALALATLELPCAPDWSPRVQALFAQHQLDRLLSEIPEPHSSKPHRRPGI